MGDAGSWLACFPCRGLDRESGSLPLADAVKYLAYPIALGCKQNDSFVGQQTEGSAAIGHDVLVDGQFREPFFDLGHRHRASKRQVRRLVLGLRPNVDEDRKS